MIGLEFGIYLIDLDLISLPCAPNTWQGDYKERSFGWLIFISIMITCSIHLAFLYYSSMYCNWWDFGGMSSVYIEIGMIGMIKLLSQKEKS